MSGTFRITYENGKIVKHPVEEAPKKENPMRQLIRTVRHEARQVGWFVRGEVDAQRLADLFPPRLLSDADRLKPVYDSYIKEISTDDMAVSWETSRLLYAAVKLKRPKTMLDLGSGFSSYVLRIAAIDNHNDALVYSVEDNEFWLGKTRAFLDAHGVGSANLISWDKFQKENKLKFDLIFHDLGSMDTRAAALPYVLSLLNKGGAVVLDDMHKVLYHRAAEREVKKAGLTLYSIRKHTLDEIGRFAEVAL